MHLRSRIAILAFSGLTWLAAAHMDGQAPGQGAGQAVPVRTPLPLNVDRDPAPSPDPDTVPAATSGPQIVGPAGKTSSVSKGADGRYTRTQDAYEVRLNASVIDGSGRTVQTLTKD